MFFVTALIFIVACIKHGAPLQHYVLEKMALTRKNVTISD